MGKYKIEGSKNGELYYTMSCGSKAIVQNWQSVGWRAKLKVGDEVEVTRCKYGVEELKVIINGFVEFDKERGDMTMKDIIMNNINR